jgi:hypothetical protein
MTEKMKPVAWANPEFLQNAKKWMDVTKTPNARFNAPLYTADQVKEMTERLEHERDCWKECSVAMNELLADRLEEASKVIEELVYETTRLSPEEDDGSHRCNISKASLMQARSWLSSNKGDE